MKRSTDTIRIAININAMRSRLVILGFNLTIATFQISNMRVLTGGRHIEGFLPNIHLSAGAVLLTSIALSIASMIAFISSSELDKEASCDHWPLLAADLLMYTALSQTVTGFFSPYLYALGIMPLSTQVEQTAMSVMLNGMTVAGAGAWILAAYVGPIVAFVRAPHSRVTKLLHAVGYIGIMVCISHLWLTAQRLEGLIPAEDSSLPTWLSAFTAPLFW
jgi:hypothetical protein